ncbi:MAG: extracellular solute-binding protein [Planctomycetota bacterium]|nr:extracellular solute-binding protein [Planctomycetota bacterium]
MRRLSLLILFALFLARCGDGNEARVTLYCGVDQDQSQRFADLFQQVHGIVVDYHGESEAMRSVGLPQRLMQERARPRADVYWSNEIMHMVHLCKSGVMAPLPAGLAEEFPAAWRDPGGRYVAFGARARVLLVNTELLPDPKDWPTRVEDLLDPKYAAMGYATSMAEPLTGTTYTHAVALLTGDEAAAKSFFERVAAAREQGTMKVVSSNGRVMRAVAEKSEKVCFGLTDTDDSFIALTEKSPHLAVIYPDSSPGEAGTVLIPNTAALVKGGPNAENGVKLLRWLVSPAIEEELARGRSAQIPLRVGVPAPEEPRLQWRPDVDFQTMAIDWQLVGDNADRWRDWLIRLFKPAN